MGGGIGGRRYWEGGIGGGGGGRMDPLRDIPLWNVLAPKYARCDLSVKVVPG